VPDLFENTDVTQLDLSTIFKFYRRQEIWILYFFDPTKKECQEFKDKYIELAAKLYGIVKVGAIDCRSEEELCEEFSVYDIPKILLFTEDISDDGEMYRGKQEV